MEKNNSDQIIVKFDEVTKKYGDLVVLDKLNLEIKKNEMLSIIGPSGSGKTTVLRVLMTLEKINGGVIHLDKEPLTHMSLNGNLVEANEKYLRERRSKIGMVFQQFNLFPHMTALQNCIEAPVEVLGFDSNPLAGDDFVVVENENIARKIAEYRSNNILQKKNTVVKTNVESNCYSCEFMLFWGSLKNILRKISIAIRVKNDNESQFDDFGRRPPL